MDIFELIELCKAYAALGPMIQEQLLEIINDSDTASEHNANAVKLHMIPFVEAAERQGVSVDWLLESLREATNF